MDITGKLYISKSKDGYGFYTTIKDKRNDTKVYLPVRFRKDEDPTDGGELDIKGGFLTAYTSKQGKTGLNLFVMDYEIKYNEPEFHKQVDEFEGDLPF